MRSLPAVRQFTRLRDSFVFGRGGVRRPCRISYTWAVREQDVRSDHVDRRAVSLVGGGDLGFRPGTESGVEVAPESGTLGGRRLDRQRAGVALHEGLEFDLGDHALVRTVFDGHGASGEVARGPDGRRRTSRASMQ